MPTRSARERTEELERASLSGFGALSAESKGRESHEPADLLRTSFQVDVHRIMGSEAFGRLKGKTHVLLAPRGEGYRSRLDHTLFGSRIARTVSRGLRLNEDLTEAISLGRDLGAAAFARASDEALSLFTEEPFRHNHQSVRVVDVLEGEGQGLNLTWEVRDGIATHTGDAETPATLEGTVVRIADRIATVVGELGDALDVGVIVTDDLPSAATSVLGPTPSDWVMALCADLVHTSIDTPDIQLSRPAAGALDVLDELAREQVSGRHSVLAERARGAHCLSSLVVFYTDNPRRLPSLYRNVDAPELMRVIDFVASLTDGQALRLFSQLLLPRRSPHPS